MHIDVAIDQLKGLISFLESYRENGFFSALISSKEIALEMEIEPVFREKRKIFRKKQFGDTSENAVTLSAEESFRIEYFLFIVDLAISSIKSRFEQFKIYENIFGFLFCFKKLKSLDDDSLKSYCLNLETFLKHDLFSDIDGLYLFQELTVLRKVLQSEINTPAETLTYIKRLDFFS